ncbi:hypothetical protein Ahy_B03g067091 isoform A [Arachis hypogaea]|uniref:TraB domain-containing protein n=1 Tax=Arachis hypogaea TaxID=3818 RepID=A0A445A605_ARAHY|nr:hypothetical protein Ahy_B03g067091 isoform A [Arachis hypogaea]
MYEYKKVYLDESAQEVDSLNSRIQELEAQLVKENEECKRINSGIRKFIRVYNHNSQLQEELKRSQVRLQRLGDQLVSDIARIGAEEEDLSIDIVSNGENNSHPPIPKHNAEQNDASPHGKKLHVHAEQDVLEELKQDRSKVGNSVETRRNRKRSRWNLPAQLNDKDNVGLETPNDGTEDARPLDIESKQKRGKLNSSDNLSSEKLKEFRNEVPSTSMAAHVFDEEVEIVFDDRIDLNEIAHTENDNEVALEVKGVPLMLPPALIPHTNYSQYEGDDENVDVDGLDEGGNVDIRPNILNRAFWNTLGCKTVEETNDNTCIIVFMTRIFGGSASIIGMLMTHPLTRSQLARVTTLTHFLRPKLKPHNLPITTTVSLSRTFSFAQFSTAATRPIHTFLRPAMDDAQTPPSAAPVGDDFVHIEDLKMESLSDSMVRIDEASGAGASAAVGDLSVPEAPAESSDRRHPELPEELSRNVMVLSCESSAEGGVCDVYLVGTAHVSEESSREVQAIVSLLQPEVVFLELCSSRVAVLTLQNLKVPTMAEMVALIKKKHNMFEIASKLEVFPGSEFRVAYEEAMKYGGRITVRRTWSKMPLWHKTKFLYSLLFQAVFLPSSDDLNKMLKQMNDSDVLTLVIQEMSKQFPTLMETLVHERDQYMSSTLLKVASENRSVVAVVGKGHLQGIKKHWKQPVMMRDLMTVPSPKPAMSAIKILTSVGVAVAGVAIISGIYLSSKK